MLRRGAAQTEDFGFFLLIFLMLIRDPPGVLFCSVPPTSRITFVQLMAGAWLTVRMVSTSAFVTGIKQACLLNNDWV